MPTEKKPQKPRASLKKHVTRAPKGLPAKAGAARAGTPTKPDTPTTAGTNKPGTAKGGIAKAGTAKTAATKGGTHSESAITRAPSINWRQNISQGA